MNTPARLLGLSVCLTLVALFAPGCGGEKKITPLPIGEMKEFRDGMYGFRFTHPAQWVQGGESGRPRFLSSLEAGQRFLDPLGSYPDGVMIAVDVTRTPTPDQQKIALLAELKSSGRVLGQESAVTIGGKSGVKVAYTASFSTKVKETGQHIYVSLDTVLYDVSIAGFGDLFAAHEAIFDSVLKSFTFPRPVEKGRDETLPAEACSDNNAGLFAFQYPENFNFVSVPKGTNDLALALRGVRQDCSILFHVFGAKGLTLEKAFDQNKGKYAGAVPGKATIGGQPALSLTYAPTREVERRFYFLVKADKVYRITMDWYKPQRQEYLAAYDKVLSSIKFK
jgi:hypothetical protein